MTSKEPMLADDKKRPEDPQHDPAEASLSPETPETAPSTEENGEDIEETVENQTVALDEDAPQQVEYEILDEQGVQALPGFSF